LTTADRTSDRTSDRHPAQWLALVIGAVYTLVGVVGFFVTGFDGFAEPSGELLLGVFEINPLHNIVHLIIGIAGLVMWNRLDRARLYGWLLAAGYGLAFLYGLFVANREDPANFLALNQNDNWLHLISAAAGLAIALWPARQTQPTRSRVARS
jgi:ABC-type transport system involved in multi-copper enzyme maturation permease subunit